MASQFLLADYAASHRTGHHCGSTAMRNLILHETGADLSEESVFGLSGAIWFFLVSPPLSPTDLAFGRTITLETGICEALSLPYAETDADDAAAWPVVRDEVQRGRPVVLMGDSAKLDYFGGPPFPGHRFLLIGFDEAREVAILADRKWEQPQEVSLASLARSRSDGSVLSARNLWGVPTGPWPDAGEVFARARDAAPGALRLAAERMLDVDAGTAGVAGIRAFARRIAALSPERRKDVARANGFILERGGNGGGLFRRMYARFLREHEASLGAWASPLAAEFDAVADQWTAIAASLFARSKVDVDEPSAGELSAMVEAVADAEEGAWRRALSNVAG